MIRAIDDELLTSIEEFFMVTLAAGCHAFKEYHKYKNMPQNNDAEEGPPTVKLPAPSINFLYEICRSPASSAILSVLIYLLVCAEVAVAIPGKDLSPPDPADDMPPVTIEYSALDQTTVYTASRGDCSIQWIAYSTGPNQGVIKHSPRCAAPLALQFSLLSKICAVIFSPDKDPRAFRTLFWGGLEAEGKPASQELPLRLALAAYQSPDWDVRKGKPKNGDVNGFIKNLANKEPIYPELKELFRRFNRNITLSIVEKVRVLEAEKLPFYDRLKQQGVAATDRLPFDCMAWFSLSAISP